MKTFFDTILVLGNLAAVVALVAIKWLSTRYHWMTGPEQWATIGRVQLLALICSFSALIIGVAALPALRALKRHGYEDLGSRQIWAYASVTVSVVLAFMSLLPTRGG
jgi:uncharacterized membrane protein YidH (DUF202 family)